MQVSCEKCGHRFASQASTGIIKCPSCSAGIRLAARKAGRQEMPTMVQKITKEQLAELQDPEPEPAPAPKPSIKRKAPPACSKGHPLAAPGALCRTCEGKKKTVILIALAVALLIGVAVVFFLLLK